MELVYGAISTTFFTLLLIGTLVYRARKNRLIGGGPIKTDFVKSDEDDEDAEAFLKELADQDDDDDQDAFLDELADSQVDTTSR
jgi:hypothetical protein